MHVLEFIYFNPFEQDLKGRNNYGSRYCLLKQKAVPQ